MNKSNRYEVYDRSGPDLRKIESLPDMVQGKTDLDSVSDILKHLMRYRFAKDLSKKALYVYVYNLGFGWQIVNISRGCEVVPPPNPDLGFRELRRRITTAVPIELKGKGIRQCDDIIKVLITSQPTSFDLLELPKLSKVESVRRSTSRVTTIRSSGYGHTGASENWAALNFPIRTFAIK
ncbi:hypothetical protein BDV30DRAFT_20599 [Aspergillus minisclerotigenes]|uniref:Uncharacterized protein n=1 Tax=Aspergillus minisclerotigenes TaxID=656917 RepID=A0A5N6IP00_9EURO|nr:hypothetical protein BDV30DRAFT_20599 [Aspergillus minisclerotigenes]